MAKNSETLESLYIRLGLDASSLTSDFISASQTVNQNLANLNRELNAEKLKLQIDLDGLDDNKQEQVKRTIESLNKQIALQADRVNLAKAAYDGLAAKQGATSAAAKKLEIAWLREQKALSSLNRDLRQLSSNSKDAAKNQDILAKYSGLKGKIGEVQSILSGMTASTDSAIQTTIGLISKIPNAYVAGVAAIAATPLISVASQRGIISLAESAADAAAKLKDIADGLNISYTEAGKFSKMMSLGGASADEAAKAMLKLDKSILSAGEDGNETTKMLARFGVSVKDASGNLLPLNEQLRQVAKGYRDALLLGQGDEFLTSTFGAKGFNLLPILRDFEKLEERASRIKSNGLLDIDEADSVQKATADMTAQWNQLKLAMSSAFVPMASEVLPDMIKLFGDLCDFIAQNKEGIKQFGMVAVDVLKAPIELVQFLQGSFKEMSEYFGIEFSPKYDEIAFIREKNRFLADVATLGEALNNPLTGGIFKTANQLIFNYYQDDFEKYKEAQAEKKRIDEEATQQEKAELQRRTAARQTYLKDMQNSQLGHEAAVKNINQANKIVYDLEHNSYEKAINDIHEWERAELAAAHSVEERNSIIQLANAKLRKSEEEVNQAVKKNLQEAQDLAYKSTHSAFENQLYQIEQTKNALLDRARTEREVESVSILCAQRTADAYAEAQNRINSLTDSIDDKIFRLTHTQMEVEIHDLERSIQRYAKEMSDLGQVDYDRLQKLYDVSMADINKRYSEMESKSKGKNQSASAYDPNVKSGGFGKIVEWGDEASRAAATLGNTMNQFGKIVEVAQRQQQAQQTKDVRNIISPNVSVNVDLGGAYVFDDSAKAELTEDITNNVAQALTDTINEMNSGNYSYGEG